MYVDASSTARMLVASFSHSGAAKRWKRARSAAAAAAATQLRVSGAAASLRAVERESLDAEEPRRRIKDERGEFSLPNPCDLVGSLANSANCQLKLMPLAAAVGQPADTALLLLLVRAAAGPRCTWLGFGGCWRVADWVLTDASLRPERAGSSGSRGRGRSAAGTGLARPAIYICGAAGGDAALGHRRSCTWDCTGEPSSCS